MSSIAQILTCSSLISAALLASCGSRAATPAASSSPEPELITSDGFTLPLCQDIVRLSGEDGAAASRRLAVAHGVREEGDMSDVRGSLRKDVIRAVITEHLPEVRACYERVLAYSPELEGLVVTEFVIDPSGAICHVEGSYFRPSLAPVFACIAENMRTWQFPAPTGGGSLNINYPFVFSSIGE